MSKQARTSDFPFYDIFVLQKVPPSENSDHVITCDLWLGIPELKILLPLSLSCWTIIAIFLQNYHFNNTEASKIPVIIAFITVQRERLKNACLERGCWRLCTKLSSLKSLIFVQFYAALR